MWRLTPMPVRQPPSRQASKDEKAAVGIAAIEAEIKTQNPVDQAGEEGQLDKPEHAAIVSPARFSKPPALSNTSSESSSLRICSSAKSNPKPLTFIAVTSSFAQCAPVRLWTRNRPAQE